MARILFIIVFISCSLYSIIFTICCSLLVLSPLHICVAYIFNTCHSAVYTKYLDHLYTCVYGIVTIK